MQENCDDIVIFPIYGQFGAIRKPDFILQKLKAELKTLLHSSHIIALSKGTIFAKKCYFFSKKMLTSAKLREPWYRNVYFLKLHMCVKLHTKCQVSSFKA